MTASNVSIIESPPRRSGPHRRAAVLAAASALTVAAVAGLVVLTGGDPDRAAAPAASPASKPSELYAADGTTLVARFDTDDPRESCLRAPAGDWGFYCAEVVTWWQAQAAFGDDAAQRTGLLRHGGYRIGGSLDVTLQAGAKRRIDALLPAGDPRAFTVASVEPGTGLIRTMAVNRDFRRPPPAPGPSPSGPSPSGPAPSGPDPLLAGAAAGAPFMMFTLAAALDSGLRLDHTIDTQKVYRSKYRIAPSSPAACDGGFWCPANTGDAAYRSGRRTMWDAFGHTVVTYFVALQEQLGADKVVAMAQRLGITFRSPEDTALGTPQNSRNWGAFTLGVSATSTLDLATAYATLAADGTRCDPLPVAKVTDRGGQPVGGVGPRCEQVLRPEVARAAADAGRCALGDTSAFGERCGTGTVPGSGVRGTVGRPVTGQTGLTDQRRTFSVVVAAPQLATAGMIAPPPSAKPAAIGNGVPEKAVTAVAGLVHDALAPLPAKDFTAPPRTLALAG